MKTRFLATFLGTISLALALASGAPVKTQEAPGQPSSPQNGAQQDGVEVQARAGS